MSTYLTLHRSLPDSPPLHPRAAHGDGGCCCCFLAHNKPPWENPMHPSREPLIWSGSGAASHHHHHQAQPQMVTYSEGLGAAERLRAGFRTFRRTIYDKNPMLFARLKSAQSPKYMVFACSDSRVCPSVILDLKPEEAFTVRDIAGLVLAYHQNMHSSVVSAIEFAVTILKMTIELRLLAAPSSSSWSLLLLIEEGLDMGVVTDGYLSNRNHILVPGGRTTWKDIFAAGTDTTTITLEWALSELINNPSVLRRAQAELDAVVGASRLADESDVPNLPYLQAIAKETLRLHPTGPLVVRRSMEPCKVSGYDVPAGATVFVNVWAIGRDPASWGPDPLEGENAGLDVRGQHFHLLPFGSGRRICPGASLALLVVQAALAVMVQCFEWEPVGGAPVDMEEGPGLTLPRKHPRLCTVRARLDPMPGLAADEDDAAGSAAGK